MKPIQTETRTPGILVHKRHPRCWHTAREFSNVGQRAILDVPVRSNWNRQFLRIFRRLAGEPRFPAPDLLSQGVIPPMPRVLNAALSPPEGPHVQILEQNGFELVVNPRDRDLRNEDNLIEALQGFDAVIASADPYTARVIEAAPELRVIARCGVGFDAIDLEACDRAGVVVATTPGVNHHSVAEHALALLLGVARGFPDLDRRVRENRWKRIARPRVMGSTLGIVGLGRIGRAVATRAIGLGMNVVAYEPYPNQEFVEQWKIELLDVETLLARSDFVSLHLPAMEETRHFINAETLAKMKPGSVLINTARGMLVDETALCDALRTGQLRGAGLDVFEVEPLPLESPLLALDNVLLAGHVAGLDEQSHHDTFAMLAHTIVSLYQGDWPAECIQNLKGVRGWTWHRD